jgi:hypothetical protein
MLRDEKEMGASPSALMRLLGLGYLALMLRVPTSNSKPPLLQSEMLLPMCMACILTTTLWSGSGYNVRVGRLEASVLYFLCLQLLLSFFGPHNRLQLSTHAALCLSWHAAQGVGLVAPDWIRLLQTSLCLFFMGFVPLLWSMQEEQKPDGNCLSQLLLCDLSLVMLEGVQWLYGLVWVFLTRRC